MTDPYAGIEMPNPPKGYRLTEWGETADRGMWWCPSLSIWRAYMKITAFEYSFPETSIFAIPKPRMRLESDA